ncbi:MAG TPA: Crp/Fnr family transcriptional regulator [Candidatus Limnocylindria bacterium]|nr:Crp/Fnr family transcriptional regulator [Candidatus Limnocylindria bacterium]
MEIAAAAYARNRVLAGLSGADLEFVAPHLRPRALARDEELCAGGALIETIYFPFSGLVSLIAPLSSGHEVEVGVIGRDGMFGALAYPGARSLPARASGQIAGNGVEIAPERFWEACSRSVTLRATAARAAQAQVAAMAQTAACNSAHEVGQRLARWLLIARDAAASDDLSLTHALLAIMIGAQRPTVTLAARRLQDARIIDYRRGRIHLNDLAALEAHACECYRAVRNEMERLLGAGEAGGVGVAAG